MKLIYSEEEQGAEKDSNVDLDENFEFDEDDWDENQKGLTPPEEIKEG